MPRIVGDLAAPEAAGMLGNGLAVLADDDPIGIGPHVHRPADGAGRDAVLVVVEAHQTGLRDRHLAAWKPSKGPRYAIRKGRLLEHLPHRLARDRRMRMLLGVLDAPIHEPLVDLGIGAAPRAAREQAPAKVSHLLLNLPLLPASPGRARHRALRARGRATGSTRWCEHISRSGGCSPASCR